MLSLPLMILAMRLVSVATMRCWKKHGVGTGTALLDNTSNPFKPLWGSGEDEEGEEDEADEHYKAEFNLENPAHCNALYTWLNDRIS